MKTFVTIMLSLALTVAVLGAPTPEPPFSGNKRPARSIQIGKLPVISLQAQKKGQTEIVVARNASKVTKYAAEELRKYLEKILVVNVPVVNTPNKNKISFLLGISPWSKKAGIQDAKLCRDAFMIKVIGKNVYILGRDASKVDPVRSLKGGIWGLLYEHGTLFGVYDFLERFAGVRFYFPGKGILVPSGKALLIPQINIYDRPDYEVRNVSIYSGTWEDEKRKNKDPFSAAVSPQKNKFYAYLRLQTKYVPNCHGLSRLGYVERFAKTHPEYFALRSDGRRYCMPAMRHNGQPCFSSKLTEEIYQDAVALLTGKPASSRNVITPWGVVWDPTGHNRQVFGMMPQDGFTLCRCKKCQKHFSKGEQATSDFIWSKVIELGNRLKKDHIKGYVSMMAYYPYHLVPDMDIPENVLVMAASKGSWSLSDPQRLKKDNARIRQWVKKLGRKTWLWNYSGKFGVLNMPGVPATTPRSIGKYYGDLSNDIYGAYMESETDKLIYHYLNYYIFSKVCWDNKTDVDALLKEHYQRMFGKAAPVMGKIFDRIEELWVNRIGGRTVQTVLGPMGAPPSENELWNKVYSKVEIKNMTNAFNKAEKLTAGDKKSLKLVKYIRKEFLNPIVNASKQYWKRNNAISDFQVAMPVMKTGVNLKAADGSFNASVWGKIPAINLQALSSASKTKLVHTTVKLAEDSKNIYLLFDCKDPDINKAVAIKRKRDDMEIWKDNSIEMFLNPSGDRKTYYQFMINSKGSLTDQACINVGSKHKSDLAWNSNATVKTTIQKDAWKVEVTIPKKSLAPFNKSGFVANFCRSRVIAGKKTELYTWSPFIRSSFHEIENFGKIIFGKLADESIVQGGDFNVIQKGHNVFGKWISARKVISKTKVCLDDMTFVFGSKSLRLNAADPKMKGFFGVHQMLPAMKPNTRYKLSYYIKTDNIVPFKARGGACMNIWDDKNLWFPKNKIIGTLPWIKQTFLFTSGPKTNFTRRSYIKAYLLYSTGTVWFDGVKLEEVKK